MLFPSIPSDDDLRAFLLGTLADERVEAVRVWLDADVSHAARLTALTPQDTLTGALGARVAPDAPADSVQRVVRGVADALHSTANHGATVQKTRPPVAEPVWPPTKLGEYCVVREIGRGGMGVVLEVADDTLNRRVAAKVLNPDLAKRPDATARFLREARAIAKVEHDNVVPILHVGVEAGAPYIVMPLLKGEPLDKRLKREGALPVTEVVRIGREIAAGLGAAHAKGLIHRDMKPANVWLDAENGRARVLDFGLARQGDGTDAMTETGAIQGTPAYMAPEQIDGLPPDARADLFALGAILYECATGKRAFPGATITAVLKAVATHDPEPPTGVNSAVPPGLSALILLLLAKDPAGRFASAAEVGVELARVSPTGTGTMTWAARPTPAKPKARWAGLLAGGAVLAMMLAVGIYFGTRPRQTEIAQEPPKGDPVTPVPPPKVETPKVETPKVETRQARYKGKVDVLVERSVEGKARLLRLDEPGALPLTADDRFRIEGEVDPPAYLYLVWIDPDHDVTPAYPWNPEADRWQGTRPTAEELTGKVSLPRNKGERWRAPKAKAGMATMVLFARPTPLDVSDDALERWFKELPELPLPPGGNGSAVWFDNYAVVTHDPARRAGFVRETTNDPFERWQGQLQKSLGEKVSFQTAVSFARTGRR